MKVITGKKLYLRHLCSITTNLFSMIYGQSCRNSIYWLYNSLKLQCNRISNARMQHSSAVFTFALCHYQYRGNIFHLNSFFSFFFFFYVLLIFIFLFSLFTQGFVIDAMLCIHASHIICIEVTLFIFLRFNFLFDLNPIYMEASEPK